MVKFRFYDPDEDEKPSRPASRPSYNAFAPEVPVGSSKPISGLTLDWVHSIGWRTNPFTQLSPKPAHAFLVGYESQRQDINLFFIKEFTFGTVTGESGMGKSFLLQWLSEELAGYGNRFETHLIDARNGVAAFTSAIVSKHETLLKKYRGASPAEFLQFLKQNVKNPKRMVILVDNADELGDLEPYLLAIMDNNLGSVILAGKKPKPLADDKLRVRLTSTDWQDALKLIEKRVQAVGGSSYKPFTPKLIEELWSASKGNFVLFFGFASETAMKIALKQIVIDEEAPEEFLLRARSTPPDDSKNSKSKSKDSDDKKGGKKQKNIYDDLISGLAK